MNTLKELSNIYLSDLSEGLLDNIEDNLTAGSDYMDNETMHTFEHMFATFVRNSAIADDVLYFGPMGCQTGFYLLVRNADNNTVRNIVINVLTNIINYNGEVFGNSEIECGNYKSLNLEKAKSEAKRFLDNLSRDTNNFIYPKGV